jgi:hypothetical protein
MPLHSKRVMTIITDECNKIAPRFGGYNNQLLQTLAEILQLERNHRVQGTNVRQKVSDQIAALGDLISRDRAKKKAGKN